MVRFIVVELQSLKLMLKTSSYGSVKQPMSEDQMQCQNHYCCKMFHHPRSTQQREWMQSEMQVTTGMSGLTITFHFSLNINIATHALQLFSNPRRLKLSQNKC